MITVVNIKIYNFFCFFFFLFLFEKKKTKKKQQKTVFKSFTHMVSFGMFLYCKYKVAADKSYVFSAGQNEVK